MFLQSFHNLQSYDAGVPRVIIAHPLNYKRVIRLQDICLHFEEPPAQTGGATRSENMVNMRVILDRSFYNLGVKTKKIKTYMLQPDTSSPGLKLVPEFRKTNFFFKRQSITAMGSVDELMG